MKIHDIISPANIVTEANDDLFPGLDSSAFDDTKTTVQKPDSNDPHYLETQVQKYQDMFGVYYQTLDRLTAYLEDNDAMLLYSGRPGTNEVAYESFDWIDKYPQVEDTLSSVAISKTSPLFKNIEKHIRSLNNAQGRIDFSRSKITELRSRIKAIKTQTQRARTHRSTTSFVAYAKNAPHLPAPNPMPSQIRSSTGRMVGNPYFAPNASKQYAGHVAHYPHWTGYWKDQIMQVEEILKRNGKSGLGMMYAATHNNGGGRFNFIITGANGKLTWRKYDPSPGAGQNWMILDGKKMNTSVLLGAAPAKQDAMVQSL